jgi:hypothetical protein
MDSLDSGEAKPWEEEKPIQSPGSFWEIFIVEPTPCFENGNSKPFFRESERANTSTKT